MVRQAWSVVVRLGTICQGVAVTACLGLVRRGPVRFGRRGKVRWVSARSVSARLGMAGRVRRVKVGSVRVV